MIVTLFCPVIDLIAS